MKEGNLNPQPSADPGRIEGRGGGGNSVPDTRIPLSYLSPYGEHLPTKRWDIDNASSLNWNHADSTIQTGWSRTLFDRSFNSLLHDLLLFISNLMSPTL